jgi:hypothetical protein
MPRRWIFYGHRRGIAVQREGNDMFGGGVQRCAS